MNIKQKLFSAGVSGLMVMSLVAPSAFASNHIVVKHNGPFSWNHVKVVNVNSSNVTQGNLTVAGTFVNAQSNTGGNNTGFNTGGKNSIDTGKSTTTVKTVVGGSTNDNTTNCDCESTDPNTNVTVKNNGAFSGNYVKVVNVNENDVTQLNGTVAITAVNATSNTGGNNNGFNTGGSNSTDTGDASSSVTTIVGGSSNTNN